jgi:hypothetical protein
MIFKEVLIDRHKIHKIWLHECDTCTVPRPRNCIERYFAYPNPWKSKK